MALPIEPDRELKDLIRVQCGVGIEGDAEINLVVETAWDFYADKARQHPRLRFYYVRRELLESLLGRHHLDVTGDDAGYKSSDSDISKNLQALYDRTQTEIDKIEARRLANRPAVIGQLATTAPADPVPALGPNPNDPAYRGSPIRPRYGHG